MIHLHKALLTRGDKILLLMRNADAEYLADCWDLPGCTCDKQHEPSPKPSCIEERIAEQTNLDAKVKDIIGEYEFGMETDGKPAYHVTLYQTDSYFGDVRMGKGFNDYRWATREEIKEMDCLAPYLIDFLDHS